MADRYVRLADTSGGFYDPDTKFKLMRDQIALLTRPIGKRTANKLAMGGIIEHVPTTPPDDSSLPTQAGSPVPDLDLFVTTETETIVEQPQVDDPGPPPETKEEPSFWEKKKSAKKRTR